MKQLLLFICLFFTVYASATSSSCAAISLTVNPNDIHKVSCGNSNNGSITFTVANGSSNNLYRIRKRNFDGSYTTVSFPAYSPVGNLAGETKTTTVSGLAVGNYDLYVYCNEDASKFKVYFFSITKEDCGTPPSYSCSDLKVDFVKSNVISVGCNSDNDGSVMFTVTGGFPNNLYRLRKKDANGVFKVVSYPVFSSVNNVTNESKDVVVNGLSVGEYDLYVYCANDPGVYKAISFFVNKAKCTLVPEGMLAHYSFNTGSVNDEESIKTPAVVTGATQVYDNYADPKGAYQLDGVNNKLTFNNFADIDTMPEYSVSFWCKLNQLPTVSPSLLMCMPNGTFTSRFELYLEKSGTLKVKFGKALGTTLTNNSKGVVEVNKWCHIVITHAADSNRIYINNKKVSAFASYVFNNNIGNLIVGYDGKNASAKFAFDELRLYNRAINDSEISSIYFNEAKENCSGIKLTIGYTSTKQLAFTVANGSANNKYRIRKKNDAGVFVSIYANQFLSMNNYLGETKTINVDGLTPGTYDVFAYCGTDATKYQGYEVLIRAGYRPKLLRLTNPTQTDSIVSSDVADNAVDNTPLQAIEKESYAISVYPNPADAYLNVDVIASEDYHIQTVRLVATNGQVVFEQEYSRIDLAAAINVEHIIPGIYFVEVVMSDQYVERRQIVIQ